MFFRLDLKNRGSRLIDSRPTRFAAHEGHYRSFIHEAQFIDKNSLWGGLNIQKKELCVKGILAQNRFLEASGNFSTNVPFYRDPFSQLPMNDDHLYGDPDYPWDAYLQS